MFSAVQLPSSKATSYLLTSISSYQQRAIKHYILMDLVAHIGMVLSLLFLSHKAQSVLLVLTPRVIIWTGISQLVAFWLHQSANFNGAVLVSFLGRVAGMIAITVMSGVFELSLIPHLFVPVMLLSFVLVWRTMLWTSLAYFGMWLVFALALPIEDDVSSTSILFGLALLIAYGLISYRARWEQIVELNKTEADCNRLRAELLEYAVRYSKMEKHSELLRASVADWQHDLRNPLAAILLKVSSLERYRDRMTPEQYQKSLLGIRNSIHQMNLTLVDGIDLPSDVVE